MCRYGAEKIIARVLDTLYGSVNVVIILDTVNRWWEF